ncbi:hypothetical protein LO80_01955 [Candidatus Francisella endociliophora]|uniref:chorismate mutase n=1 Tax=Candidatus Francisella endociliophora TaxID=653937 RepID=A0A097EMT3_9GAMM|nr:chorismate mutase [Francisella sp. FSC1006]AIT08863.1 hypothetical protein LO80_01955 [Francisella sp. FSC1006]
MKRKITIASIFYILATGLLFADTSGAVNQPIQHLRKQIDKIDEQIIKLVEKRDEVVKKLTDYKSEHNLPVISPERNVRLQKQHEILAGKYNVSQEKIDDVFKAVMTP